ILSTPLICCSIGVATDCSTVSASEPGSVADTTISGGVIFGKRDTGTNASETRPTMMVMSEITIARIGRRIKKADMLTPLRRRRRTPRYRLHQLAITNSLYPFNDDLIPSLEALFDYPERIYLFPYLYLPNLSVIVSIDDRYLVTGLQLIDRPLRHQKSTRSGSNCNSNANKLARAQNIVWVGEQGFNSDRAGLLVYISIDGGKLALNRV